MSGNGFREFIVEKIDRLLAAHLFSSAVHFRAADESAQPDAESSARVRALATKLINKPLYLTQTAAAYGEVLRVERSFPHIVLMMGVERDAVTDPLKDPLLNEGLFSEDFEAVAREALKLLFAYVTYPKRVMARDPNHEPFKEYEREALTALGRALEGLEEALKDGDTTALEESLWELRRHAIGGIDPSEIAIISDRGEPAFHSRRTSVPRSC